MSSLGMRLASSSASRCSSAARRLNLRSLPSRSVHRRVELPYSIEDGLGNFLPPNALKTVAIEYQEGLLKRVDELVRGSPEANESIAQTVLNTAVDRTRVLEFNYASLALNNSYFLDQLKPPSTELESMNHEQDMSKQLDQVIKAQYGSLSRFKAAFSAAAMGMFTNGWVWWVTDRNGNTGIIPTFGPGTLLIRSRSYMGLSKDTKLGADLKQFDPLFPYENITLEDALSELTDDLEGTEEVKPLRSPTGTSPASPPPSSPVSGISSGKQPHATHNPLGPRFMTTYQTKVKGLFSQATEGNADVRIPKTKVDTLNMGETLYPLCCISVHEHMWLSAGYGVWGKEKWVKEFWSVLDWQKVSRAYSQIVSPTNF
ncbi:hypothetical protein H0H92_015710 [Tricholoma furcatifolium]|nr:hypothetical protein H0H92_015710 [Tricholoma furcatifolium]